VLNWKQRPQQRLLVVAQVVLEAVLALAQEVQIQPIILTHV
jgi:hypothetical protein